MEPVDDKQTEPETSAPPTPQAMRVVALVTGLVSVGLLAGSVIVFFALQAYQPALIMAGIALFDPVLLQLALGRVMRRPPDLSEVDLDSPFERYFYEQEIEASKQSQFSSWSGPVLGAGMFLLVAGIVMDEVGLAARILPLFVLWAIAAFMLAQYAGFAFDLVGRGT